MSSATPSSAAPDEADSASSAPTVGAGSSTLPPAPAVVTAPARNRPTVADVVAAAVVWLGVVLGVAAKLYAAGWFVLVVLALAPVTIALPVAAAWIVTLPLVGLGAVRNATVGELEDLADAIEALNVQPPQPIQQQQQQQNP